LLIANQLTGPLSILQEKIGQLRLGRKNEIIDYQANDEIGSLVEEYNRMVRELEMSAELLASSERESAWKEMARQVAHEVKNPLTPMKLSVQYLLKAWEDGKPDFDARLRRFRDAMLEQIETLSAIASEFSYFAKLPETRKAEADLREILQNVLEFFQTNEEGVHIRRGAMPDSAKVLVDRDQMLRVFNNVVRNAIQAIPADREGRVEVRLYRRDRYFWVEIADNGTGIPEEIRDRIFTPNFTTKGSGMGLGLAMTKTIIENMDGDIKFQTETNRGTTFYIRIPGLD
jgi:nitrogen fixation/metabolism regulation signal transduction histidine kinase